MWTAYTYLHNQIQKVNISKFDNHKSAAIITNIWLIPVLFQVCSNTQTNC